MLAQTITNELNVSFPENVSIVSGQKRCGTWKAKLPAMFIGEYHIIPITSVKMLKSEAYQLDNSCHDFAFMCAALEYCAFSVRSWSGQRLATLGLKNDHGYWRFDKCLGLSDGEVLEECVEFLDEDGILQIDCFPNELYYVVHDVVRRMNSGETH